MKVPYSWLQELVDLDGLTPEEVGQALTNAGLEVEEVETTGPVFTQVLVAKVDKVDPHPNADKLRLVTVNKGDKGIQQVVCGAPNVREGIKIAFAQSGAKVLNRKTGETFELGEAVIRGVPSSGMVCSIDELGLNEQYPSTEDGIWVLDTLVTDKDLGQPLETVLGLEKEIILHTAPTANRGDWMSMLGVAREVAGIFKRDLKLDAQLPAVPEVNHSPITLELPQPERCSYYALTLLDNIQVQPSPVWMQKRLQAAGVRSINNVVDITNYVMLLTGQPMHAFDQAKLAASGEISVRPAAEGEKLVTLDGVELNLKVDNTLITFNNQPVALAGVMGGEHSGIVDSTQNIVLEIAHFPSAQTRKSSRAAGGLRSESSARFERGVDLGGQELALQYTLKYLQELCGATVTHFTVKDYRQLEANQITFELSRFESVLGYAIPQQDIELILNRLGFNVTIQNAQLQATVPSFRANDVKLDVDVIEEVARIYGYDHAPYTLPQVAQVPERSFRGRSLALVRQTLLGLGLSEVTTLSLVSENQVKPANALPPHQQPVKVVNSNSQEHTVLRQSLVPGLLDVIGHYAAQSLPYCWVFELGRHYYFNSKQPLTDKNTAVNEPLFLGVSITGSPVVGEKNAKSAFKPDYYTLKGVLDELLEKLGLTSLVQVQPYSEDERFHPGQCGQIVLDKKVIGVIGQIHPVTVQQNKWRNSVFLLEVNLEPLLKKAQQQDLFKTTLAPISAFPFVERDIAFVAPLSVSHQAIVDCLNSGKDPLLKNITLFDEYKGQGIEDGHRSLAYRLTLGSLEKTLTEQEIEASTQRLKETLSNQLGVQYRV